MPHPAADPTPCPACGHPVYRPMMTPVVHEHLACRAVVSGEGRDADRCGCADASHRVATLRPRHRLEPGAVRGLAHLDIAG